jgi:hypothetical protein
MEGSNIEPRQIDEAWKLVEGIAESMARLRGLGPEIRTALGERAVEAIFNHGTAEDLQRANLHLGVVRRAVGSDVIDEAHSRLQSDAA